MDIFSKPDENIKKISTLTRNKSSVAEEEAQSFFNQIIADYAIDPKLKLIGMAREFATFKFASFYANLKANLIGDFKEIYSEKLWLKPPSKIPIDGALYDDLVTVNDMSVLTFIPKCLGRKHFSS